MSQHTTSAAVFAVEIQLNEVFNFVWVTKHGEHFRPRNMRTTHLFRCLRIVFNALAPARLRLPGRVVRLRWSARYCRAAVLALLCELRKRELTVRQAEEMATMREAAKAGFPNYSEIL